jgi:hypothetical protein
MGDDCHVFGSQKVLHSQSSVRGHVVVMEHPVLAPFVWSAPLHIHPKPPQDFGVEVRMFGGRTWRDEFLKDNPVNIKKSDQH